MFLPSFKSKLILLALIISTILTIASVVLIVNILPGIINNEIFKSVQLTEETKQYDRFVKLPFPLTFKVYLFHVQNPESILTGDKPLVKEVGPYVYKEYREKTVVGKNDEEDTLSYKERQRFEFDRDASGGLSDNDIITILNTPLISVLQEAENYGQTNTISSCLEDIFPKMATVFIDVKVKDFLFDGLGFCSQHLSICEIRRNVVCKIAETKRNTDKASDGSLKFSLFNYKNNSDDVFTVERGIKEIHSLGQSVLLNNRTFTNFWEKRGRDSPCDDIRGTRSTVFPPQVTKNSKFKIFSPDICRSIAVEFSNEDFYKNIKGFTFAPTNQTLRSALKNKTEDCFCAEETLGTNREKTCFLDGVVDVQPCFGAPVLLSFPHFLWADRVYLEGIKGLYPQEEIHKSFLTIEPDTGTPLQAQIRIQINTVLRPIPHIKQTTNLSRVVFPLFWVEEGFALKDEYIDELNETYFQKVELVNIIKWAILGGSLILTMFFAGYYLYNRRSK